MLRLVLAAALATLATGARAAPTAYDTAFAAEFGAACVPGRLGYETSKAAALAAGWSEVTRDAHPELDTLLARSEQEASNSADIKATFAFTAYAKPIEGTPHYLLVTSTGAVFREGEKPWVQTGCYLYNFDATAPLDPEPVTALIGNPVSARQEQDGVVAYIWGPPCPMPMTFDTYLSFVPEGSAMAAEMGLPFSGLALNFTTTALAEGEPVPAPYC